MSINKINVKNKIYDFGGSKAKLVESVELSGDPSIEETFIVDLNNVLEVGKTYLLVYIDNVEFYNSSSMFVINNEFEYSNICGFITMLSSDTDSLVQVTYNYNVLNNSLRFTKLGDNLYYDGQVIEVYELPFTIGGAE